MCTQSKRCRPDGFDVERTLMPRRFLLEGRAFILKFAHTSIGALNEHFYIIGVVVVVLVIAGFLGLRV
jgi:hypothetical protein